MTQARNPFDKTVPHSVYVPLSKNERIVRMAEVSGMSVSEYLVFCAELHLSEQEAIKHRLDHVFGDGK